MEYMDGGSLHHLIHREGIVLPLPRLLQIGMDVAQGCHYLHRQKPMIIHRDLKSQNILLTAGGLAKIADFGLSRWQQDMASMTGQVGTPGWTAPEVYKHNSYNHKVDVYSFAVVLAECLSCEKPYAGMDAMQIAFATVYRNKRPTLPPNAPTALEKLTKLCWDNDPKKRPPFSRIIEQLRAIERTTAKEAAAAASSDRASSHRASHDRSSTSAEPHRPPGARGSMASANASRPKGSASTAAPRERAGSPNGAQRLRRQLEKGANAARASGALSEKTPTGLGLAEKTPTGLGLAEKTPTGGAGAAGGAGPSGSSAAVDAVETPGAQGGAEGAGRSKSPVRSARLSSTRTTL